MVTPKIKELEQSLEIMDRYGMDEAWLERIDGKLYTFQCETTGSDSVYVTEQILIEWIDNLKS